MWLLQGLAAASVFIALVAVGRAVWARAKRYQRRGEPMSSFTYWMRSFTWVIIGCLAIMCWGDYKGQETYDWCPDTTNPANCVQSSGGF